ncbi:VOC family protein [Flavobacterium circumlabens]|uniref:Glyoxalase superfamily protein PhnB n=1 Tax=Flavobacterium circumlabens TaxID=2133765 RepID=A0A4Y7U8H4_9FLAO|nr:VOC family protein [Flavobacterium circumlabens]TCN54542.1 putative glyoxalase superfamily protein PhnB [Flavobacterium circumlabens]TEB42746.1 VOC family protein [Flavobacterium circumlabens]
MKLPAGHQTIMPYLILDGALQFIAFTQNVFNAETSDPQSFRDDGTVMHAEIRIDGSTIMVTDESKDWKKQTANLFVYVPDADATFEKAVQAGATVLMPPSDQDYGRACGVTDPFGNVWWITAVKK